MMTSGPLVDFLRRLRGVRGIGERTDEELLERFVLYQEESAFEALVQRHGPMVLGVCRHLLADTHDVEDSFQATFLVLVSKAASIRTRTLLANWLYRVAYRVALRARANAARRKARETQGVEMAAAEPETGGIEPELRPVLYEELNRLPEKYRVPVVLCYLQGKTNEEAARHLSWPIGTVKGRLTRARELLRTRLTRRGLTHLPAPWPPCWRHQRHRPRCRRPCWSPPCEPRCLSPPVKPPPASCPFRRRPFPEECCKPCTGPD